MTDGARAVDFDEGRKLEYRKTEEGSKMKIADLPRIEPTEEEIKHYQHMAKGDGDECPITINRGEKSSKENKDHNE